MIVREGERKKKKKKKKKKKARRASDGGLTALWQNASCRDFCARANAIVGVQEPSGAIAIEGEKMLKWGFEARNRLINASRRTLDVILERGEMWC